MHVSSVGAEGHFCQAAGQGGVCLVVLVAADGFVVLAGVGAALTCHKPIKAVMAPTSTVVACGYVQRPPPRRPARFCRICAVGFKIFVHFLLRQQRKLH